MVQKLTEIIQQTVLLTGNPHRQKAGNTEQKSQLSKINAPKNDCSLY